MIGADWILCGERKEFGMAGKENVCENNRKNFKINLIAGKILKKHMVNWLRNPVGMANTPVISIFRAIFLKKGQMKPKRRKLRQKMLDADGKGGIACRVGRGEVGAGSNALLFSDNQSQILADFHGAQGDQRK